MRKLKSEINFSAQRSRGPGGQNVNKVASAALLTWDFERSTLLTELEKGRIRSRLGSQINREGLLYLRSDEYRDFPRNKERCLEKLEQLLERAFFMPKERKLTKATRASSEQRLQSKSERGIRKREREKKWDRD